MSRRAIEALAAKLPYCLVRTADAEVLLGRSYQVLAARDADGRVVPVEGDPFARAIQEPRWSYFSAPGFASPRTDARLRDALAVALEGFKLGQDITKAFPYDRQRMVDEGPEGVARMRAELRKRSGLC